MKQTIVLLLGVMLAAMLVGQANAYDPGGIPDWAKDWVVERATCEPHERMEGEPNNPCSPTGTPPPLQLAKDIEFEMEEVQFEPWEEPKRSYCAAWLEISLDISQTVPARFKIGQVRSYTDDIRHSHSRQRVYAQVTWNGKHQYKIYGTQEWRLAKVADLVKGDGKTQDVGIEWRLSDQEQPRPYIESDLETGIIRMLLVARALDNTSTYSFLRPQEEFGTKLRIGQKNLKIGFEYKGFWWHADQEQIVAPLPEQTRDLANRMASCVESLRLKVNNAKRKYDLDIDTRETNRAERRKAEALALELDYAKAVQIANEKVHVVRIEVAETIQSRTAELLLVQEQTVQRAIEVDREVNDIEIAIKEAELESLEKTSQWLSSWAEEKRGTWDDLAEAEAAWKLRVDAYELQAQADLDTLLQHRETITADLNTSRRRQAELQGQLAASDTSLDELQARLAIAEADLAEAERQYAEFQASQ